MTETVCGPTKPEIFTVWPITENVCQPLLINSCKYCHNKDPSLMLLPNEIGFLC